MNNEKPEFVKRGTSIVDASYQTWLKDLKQRYRSSQLKAAVKVNDELLKFYWSLGRDIAAMHSESKYGSNFFDTLSMDLREEFPEQKGFSATNIRLTVRWHLFYNQQFENRHQLGTEFEMPADFAFVPWRHHVEIIRNASSVSEAMFYIHKVIEGNWSRSYLLDMIKSDLYSHQGHAITNFNSNLPAVQSQLANEIFKDTYRLDFIPMTSDYQERDLEDALANNITRFLLELGRGFAYIGRQMELRMPGGKTFFPDMIFYHTRLKCYIVLELKVVEFIPEFAGKLNFYVSAADELLKQDDDNPSIGLLICKSKDNTVVEWSFRGMNTPMGVASYELKAIAENLPSVEDIEAALKANDMQQKG